MATLLLTGTHGTDDPTRASMPFHIGKGAKEAGYDVEIVLAVDAPVILKDAIRESMFGVGMPALKELMQFAIDNRIRVYV
jgi:predicted peroxiredoxin